MNVVVFGVFLHAVAALCAANCYAPQKYIKRWSWETFWMTQAAWCWLLWPIIGAVCTIPHLGQVLAESPKLPMLYCFLMGTAFGVGGTAFNVSIRYIGFSLTYAIAIGLSGVLGMFVTPLVDGNSRRDPCKARGGLAHGRRCRRRARHRTLRRSPDDSRNSTCKQRARRPGRVLLDQGPAAFVAGRRPLGRLWHRDERRCQADYRRAAEHGARILERQRRLPVRQSRGFSHGAGLQPLSCPKEPLAGRVDPAPRRPRRGSLAVNYLLAILVGHALVRAVLLLQSGPRADGHAYEFTSWAIQ